MSLGQQQPPLQDETPLVDIHQRSQQPLRLYIEDNRPMDTPKRTVASVLVPDHGPVLSSPPGTWSTPVKDLIEKLQDSHSAIRGGGECIFPMKFASALMYLLGPVKLGIPDDRFPEFTQYFIDGPIAKLTEIEASPTELLVSPSLPSSLTIRVEFVSEPVRDFEICF